MKIVSLDGAALNPGDLSWECFEQFGEITVYPRTHTEEETVERIGDADIVLLNKVPITKGILFLSTSNDFFPLITTSPFYLLNSITLPGLRINLSSNASLMDLYS